MTDSQILTRLAEVQDAICDIVAEPMTMREAKARLDNVYPYLAAAVDALIEREAQTVGAATR